MLGNIIADAFGVPGKFHDQCLMLILLFRLTLFYSLVPGILGARLNAKLNKPNVVSSVCDKKADWYSLWLNLEQLFPPAVDCWVDNMK